MDVDKPLASGLAAPGIKDGPGHQKPPVTWTFGAEGVGFEPTEPGGSTVFETVRFGRSRIPPGGESSDGPQARGARRAVKKACSRAAASSAPTPGKTANSWLRRGGAGRVWGLAPAAAAALAR